MLALTHRRAVAVMTAWWIASPAVVARWYAVELGRGAFPPDADSIAIPIGEYVIMWILLTPLLVAAAWWAGRGAPTAFGWWSWDAARPARGAFAGAIALLALAHATGTIALGVRGDHPLEVAHGAAGVLVALAWRALASAPRAPRTPHRRPAPAR